MSNNLAIPPAAFGSDDEYRAEVAARLDQVRDSLQAGGLPVAHGLIVNLALQLDLVADLLPDLMAKETDPYAWCALEETKDDMASAWSTLTGSAYRLERLLKDKRTRD